MLLLAAGTTLYGVIGWSWIAGKLDSGDDDLEDREDLMDLAFYACRAWSLCSIIVGAIAARGVVQVRYDTHRSNQSSPITNAEASFTQKHFPSLRIFALHAVADAVLMGISAAVFAMLALYAPSQLGHAVCEHLSRGDALGIVASPGSGLELCEEKWSYGIAPILLLLSGIALIIRAKSSLFIWYYFRQAQGEGRICLESPNSTPRHSSHEQRGQIAGQSGKSRSGRHSRSLSASTVRPHHALASRIMLLPTDYDSSSLRTPTLNVIPASPLLGSTNSSTESFETIKGVASDSDPYRKRAYSNGSAAERVVVYAPVLMSIDEAQKLGGREAVIASALSSSPTSYASSPRHRTTSPPVNSGRSGSHLPNGSATPTLASGAGSPFATVKGQRDVVQPSTTEMEQLGNQKQL